jgi:diguanylate cyclase (GGDEF)-like protein
MREVEELDEVVRREGAAVAFGIETFLHGLCRNAGAPEWFEERLREGLHWARRGVTWANYFCVMRQLEDSVLDALDEAPGKIRRFCRKLFTLELSLASEGFSLMQVETFSAAVDDLHERLTIEPLTQVSTRTHLMAALELKLIKKRKDGHRFCVLMIDVDHFKQVNDEFGHMFGDAVLKAVAARLRLGVRASDVVGRFGGEEFAILLEETDRVNARNLAERLREQVASETHVLDGERRHVTVSIGVAEALAADSIESLLARADAALYEAKHQGRNCVVEEDSLGGRVRQAHPERVFDDSGLMSRSP